MKWPSAAGKSGLCSWIAKPPGMFFEGAMAGITQPVASTAEKATADATERNILLGVCIKEAL